LEKKMRELLIAAKKSGAIGPLMRAKWKDPKWRFRYIEKGFFERISLIDKDRCIECYGFRRHLNPEGLCPSCAADPGYREYCRHCDCRDDDLDDKGFCWKCSQEKEK